MISHLCIRRPILASVLSIVLTIAGLAAMYSLPIAQYPDISPVQVTISTAYPGADAKTIEDSVAAPLEAQINGVDNMMYMQSTSSAAGQYSLTVYFKVGTDPDIAQVQVQNRISLAMTQLPDIVQKAGVSVAKRSNSFLMLLGLYSPDGRFDDKTIANYANVYVLDAIKRVPGANQASIMGVPDLAMRIWLKPDRMAALGITPTDIQRAVSAQNQQFGIGRVGASPTDRPVELTFPVVAGGRFADPTQFERIILRTDAKGAAIVRLGDVGRAEVGQKDYLVRATMNGKPTTLIAVYQQAGSNALDVAKNVRATMAEMKKTFPEGMDYLVSLDTTTFVQDSINEVVHTLFEAVVLVVLVVYLFLQNFRATVIPTIAVVVSLVGTFVGMTLLGFSINMLTLFGLVLAIGIVVDDAIVVIENVERNMHEFKLSPRDAAFKAMDEVTGPVIAIVLVLSAVFIPVAFISGTTGLLYKQFAITIVISVALSGFVALTLTPAMAALMLKPQHGEPNRFFRWFNRVFERMTASYAAGVQLTIKRVALAMLVFGVMVVAILGLFKHIPGSFVPMEDQGYVLAATILPDAASLDRTQKTTERVAEDFAKLPMVRNTSSIPGFSMIDNQMKSSAGIVFVEMKPFEERGGGLRASAKAAVYQVRKASASIQDGVVVPLMPPPIPGLGSSGGFEFWIQSKGGADYAEVDRVTKAFVAAAKKRPELADMTTLVNAASRQLKVDVDRNRAETLGVPVQDVYAAMQTLFGSLYVSQYNAFSRVFQVILQAEPKYRESPADLQNIYVRQSGGKMLPLSAVTTTHFTTGAELISRFNGFSAAKVTGNAAAGYSSGQAIQAMEEVAAETLPDGFSFAWSGLAYEEKQAGGTTAIVFAFGIIMVFLILAAQYESWGLPFSVITAVPFGIFGALVAIFLRGLENDIYFQVGLVTLVGLAAKNAILIVEFAVLKRQEGLPIVEAAVEAARLRLRPIVMTSLAFIAGAVPLAIATGAGANSRHSIGTGLIGGMIGATSLALFFVPLFFVMVQSLAEKLIGKKAESGEAHHD
ncbi:multidrug efflux RND transporter permease subunit [Niveibacterium umoris]|uniref:Efflux pump membrane transporter n=1 Tax=Niveibacterium umoris TaxID=1193620 RepID=A0A840BWF0_9RHOO|nr:multidrug efflux RND transporter permease subunit [Niveibacterium umoris]MBB4014637.1 multidrug efflux pump [Niveibacterium umoris]